MRCQPPQQQPQQTPTTHSFHFLPLKETIGVTSETFGQVASKDTIELIHSGGLCLGGAILMFTISPALNVTIVSGMVVLAMVVLLRKFVWLHSLQEKATEAQKACRKHLADITEHVKTVKHYGTLARERRTLKRLLSKEAKIRNCIATFEALFFVVEMGLLGVLYFLIYIEGEKLVKSHEVDSKTVVQLGLMATEVVWFLYSFTRNVHRYSERYSETHKIADLLGEQPNTSLDGLPSPTDSPTGHPPSPREDRGAVEFKHVIYQPSDKVVVLREVSTVIHHGKLTFVVGPSGCGKSTLLKLILREILPTIGRVLFAGRKLKLYDIRTLLDHFAVVPQSPAIFRALEDDCVDYNIVYGSPFMDPDQINKWRRKAGLAEVFKNPSGGQRQRISVLRALLKALPHEDRKRTLLLLDEPTSGLDPETEKSIVKLLRKGAQGVTVVWVTHNYDLITEADNLLVLRPPFDKDNHPQSSLSPHGRDDTWFKAQLRTMQESFSPPSYPIDTSVCL